MNEGFDPDELLKRLLEPSPVSVEESLKDLFDQKIDMLQIKKTTALKFMGMSKRTLDGILTGEQTMVDYTQLIKLSNFLGIESHEVARLYIKSIEASKNIGSSKLVDPEEISFLHEHFELAPFKKVGLIETLTDYNSIIKSICEYFGLDKIQEYRKPEVGIAFSAGKRARSNLATNNWIYLAERTCIELKNESEYDREKLIDFFPQIRLYCTDVKSGLISVINHLFQLGITVVFIPSFPSMHIRGATFEVNNKPAIAITDYQGFYPTLWFALIHELHHVLFDWQDIKTTSYHLSVEADPNNPQISNSEIEADEFARKYLFSREKTFQVLPHLIDHSFVTKFARENHVDPSFIYVFAAYDSSASNNKLWGLARKRSPKIDNLLSQIQNPFEDGRSFDDHIKYLRHKIYK